MSGSVAAETDGPSPGLGLGDREHLVIRAPLVGQAQPLGQAAYLDDGHYDPVGVAGLVSWTAANATAWCILTRILPVPAVATLEGDNYLVGQPWCWPEASLL